MRYALALAGLASLALAAPYPQDVVENVQWVVETVVETVYVTEEAAQATPVANYQAPAATPASTPAQVTPAPSYSTPAASSSNNNPSYMTIVNKWRAVMGLSNLIFSQELQDNAQKCVTESNGQMVHQLFPGTYGQVLAPGTADDFEHVFVGGWVCEMPQLLGAQGSAICAVQDNGWDHEGQTGHAEILSSPSYSKIGCYLYAGIWDCDLA